MKHNAKFLAVYCLWSGVWPHVKLVALLFIIHTESSFRRRYARSSGWEGGVPGRVFRGLVTLCFSIDPVKAYVDCVKMWVGCKRSTKWNIPVCLCGGGVAVFVSCYRSIAMVSSLLVFKERDDEHKAIKTVVKQSCIEIMASLCLHVPSFVVFSLVTVGNTFHSFEVHVVRFFVQLPGPRS